MESGLGLHIEGSLMTGGGLCVAKSRGAAKGPKQRRDCRVGTREDCSGRLCRLLQEWRGMYAGERDCQK